ncbi:MAG: adenylate kinase [Anaerovoracaceae bacterium]
MNLVIMGPPGAGKGTVSKKIVEYLEIPHISTGDIFRDNVSNATELGIAAKKYMDLGELVPDDLVIAIALDRLTWIDCEKGFLLDGFPRTEDQARAFDDFMSRHKRQKAVVINVDVPRDTLVKRIIGRRICKDCGAIFHVPNMPPKVEGICDKCGGKLYQRKDDLPETVERRIDIHNEQVSSLMEYFNKRGDIVSINGDTDADTVFKKIIKAIGAEK